MKSTIITLAYFSFAFSSLYCSYRESATHSGEYYEGYFCTNFDWLTDNSTAKETIINALTNEGPRDDS